MTVRQVVAALKADIDRHVPKLHVHSPELGDTLHTLNATGAWPDDVEVSVKQAVECWRVVQYVRELPGPLDEAFKV
ncbi:TPA: hypothetical protein ACU967_002268 [Burkholderia contaminans]|uniref:hypothetical protein n=1 Tax=Burkholderia contaminans TaxID=488447 RepID=UPI000D0045CC|nr:hypothetical protein [Burkholderia contaminans]HDR9065510.1 hypothetical protein [Burkholderia vietnamiensis]MBM6427949.1 hypothetical protein [Burkholderia contaminans]MCA7876780.1 hypothetical protein [Burkholderia contaminans]MDN8024197.1 hypothetical protein [Burkholderia contaminans]PRG12196.1 hypothetical protein C6Q17_14150 [Burkholderia contaminans]